MKIIFLSPSTQTFTMKKHYQRQVLDFRIYLLFCRKTHTKKKAGSLISMTIIAVFANYYYYSGMTATATHRVVTVNSAVIRKLVYVSVMSMDAKLVKLTPHLNVMCVILQRISCEFFCTQ